jgi:two-component system alkaline phosphatase synthesis response regulator PhoP
MSTNLNLSSDSIFSESKPVYGHSFKILLADDELDVLEFLSYNLIKEGYDVTVASNGIEALEKAKYVKPDLIILDMMMPEKNGLQTCMELRAIPEFSKTVILFLTAVTEENNQIIAFQLGADDFITKPVNTNVFLGRIKAHLRRTLPADYSQSITVGDVELNIEKFVAKVNGIEIALARKEFKLLQLLISKPGKVFSREEILNKVWGNEVIIGDRSVDVHIRKLREKIGQNYFKTIKGVGYKIDI